MGGDSTLGDLSPWRSMVQAPPTPHLTEGLSGGDPGSWQFPAGLTAGSGHVESRGSDAGRRPPGAT